MRITIEQTENLLQISEREDIEQRVELLFSRVKTLVDSIHITLSDENGPKGGVDKLCTVIIHGKLDSPIIVKDTKPSSMEAINNALRRANTALLKNWKRKKMLSKLVKGGKIPMKESGAYLADDED